MECMEGYTSKYEQPLTPGDNIAGKFNALFILQFSMLFIFS